MWICLYTNCFSGRFHPVGPFDNLKEANKYCNKQAQPELWNSHYVFSPEGYETARKAGTIVG